MIGRILWAGNDPNHLDHLHVEPPRTFSGTPPTSHPGMSDGIQVIYRAMVERFGSVAYFLNSDGTRRTGFDWYHMGGWNRRRIAGSTTWSQHAWWNALDIGPYYGVAQQEPFYRFLTGQETPVPEHSHVPMPDALPRAWADGSWGKWVQRSDTNTETRGYTFYREDLAWVYERVIAPLEREVSLLAEETADLREEVRRLSGVSGITQAAADERYLRRGRSYPIG